MVERDEELLELTADFLQETAEGLAQVEELLSGPADAAKVDSIFRVFHTIKGVAGLLELPQLVALAHTTETLLNQYREGKKAVAPDWLFDAVAHHRSMLKGLEAAVAAGVALAHHGPVDGFIAQLKEEIERDEALPAKPVEREAAPTAGARALKETLKVDAERIDTLVEMMGELIVTEAMVANSPEVLAIGAPRVRKSLDQLGKMCRYLHELAMRLRMVPVRGLFQKAVRIVHELSKQTGKEVGLEREGEDVELDRGVVDRLEEPLVHMLRNALDHGIEPKAEREAAGKAGRATLRLRALHESGQVVIEITDDGRGLQRDAIVKRARERGLISPDAELSDAEVCNLIFLPGFSTAQKVSELSGRGVGMDVVLRQVQAMHGRVTLSSAEGRGTTIRLTLPLTLAVINGMLVSCAGERYIIPSLAVVEALRPEPQMWATAGQRAEVLNLRGELLEVVRLAPLLGAQRREDGTALTVVVEGGGKKVALVVDDVLSEQQIVIKPLSEGAQAADLFSGVAILPDGRAGLILDIDRVVGRSAAPLAEARA
ncbi:MAG: chemotaxis protein CheA [Archangiaceae bacterium]|nr:chemotaxis protein CheA [Archangiaceae bacterium]